MKPLIRVKSVVPLEEYRVQLTFENNTLKEIDLDSYLRGPVFETIRSDIEVFRSMKVEDGTIVWDNGADIDPDVYYKEGEAYGLIARVDSDNGISYIAATVPSPEMPFTIEMLVASRRLIRDENVCFITDDSRYIEHMKKVFGRYGMRFVVENDILYSYNDKG